MWSWALRWDEAKSTPNKDAQYIKVIQILSLPLLLHFSQLLLKPKPLLNHSTSKPVGGQIHHPLPDFSNQRGGLQQRLRRVQCFDGKAKYIAIYNSMTRYLYIDMIICNWWHMLTYMSAYLHACFWETCLDTFLMICDNDKHEAAHRKSSTEVIRKWRNMKKQGPFPWGACSSEALSINFWITKLPNWSFANFEITGRAFSKISFCSWTC